MCSGYSSLPKEAYIYEYTVWPIDRQRIGLEGTVLHMSYVFFLLFRMEYALFFHYWKNLIHCLHEISNFTHHDYQIMDYYQWDWLHCNPPQKLVFNQLAPFHSVPRSCLIFAGAVDRRVYVSYYDMPSRDIAFYALCLMTGPEQTGPWDAGSMGGSSGRMRGMHPPTAFVSVAGRLSYLRI